MDIRTELQTLNRLLGCQNFIDVPARLAAIRDNTNQIRLNTTKRRRKVKRGK